MVGAGGPPLEAAGAGVQEDRFGRHDVQAFAHVLADAGHRLAAVRCVPQAVLSGLVMGFDATQVFGQGLAARAPARCLRSGRCLGPGGLKLGELRLQGYFVLQQLALNSVGCSPAIGAPYEAPFQHCPSSTESSSRPGSDGRDLKVAPTRSDARSRVRDRDGSPNDVWQRLGVLAVRPAPR